MRILVAPQSLKGSLEASEVGEAIATGIRRVLPEADIRVVPVADGGEGTVRALVDATGGQLTSVTATGPLGEPVRAEYGMLGGEGPRTAVLEMASASGLPLVPPERRDPRTATTFGTGQLLRAALDSGATQVILGIGGSATNDGGAGMAQALGYRLLDENGDDLPPGGAALARLARIDTTHRDSRLDSVQLRVACDVSNPLCGPTGASAVYGPQKGATPEMVAELDAALAHYAAVVRRDLGVDVARVPGAGAAGGLGAGLLAFTRAELIPGARVVFDALDFDRIVAEADLVFTAEGRLDFQTAFGKAPGAVAAAAHAVGARTIALTGGLLAGDAELNALGIDAVVPIPDSPMPLETAMSDARRLVTAAAARAMRLILIGQALR